MHHPIADETLPRLDSALPVVAAGRLLAMWVKRSRGGRMDPVGDTRLIAGAGLEGNTDQGGRRQVTLLDSAAWDAATEELGVTLDPGTRRANLLLEGVDLFRSRGRVLAIGECRLLVRGETKPCERMNEASPGLKDRLWKDWRGGAFAEVLVGGAVRVGDPLRWVEENEG